MSSTFENMSSTFVNTSSTLQNMSSTFWLCLLFCLLLVFYYFRTQPKIQHHTDSSSLLFSTKPRHLSATHGAVKLSALRKKNRTSNSVDKAEKRFPFVTCFCIRDIWHKLFSRTKNNKMDTVHICFHFSHMIVRITSTFSMNCIDIRILSTFTTLPRKVGKKGKNQWMRNFVILG